MKGCKMHESHDMIRARRWGGWDIHFSLSLIWMQLETGS